MLIVNEGDIQDMIQKILIVLKILKDNDLFVKPEKCHFFVTKVEFLGFIIEDGKITMDPSKLKGISDWFPPQTLKQIRSFIGFCNFYR